jgi:alpha-galactosidase
MKHIGHQAQLTINGKTTEIFANKTNRTDDWLADFNWEINADGDEFCRLMLHPKTDLRLDQAEIWLHFQLEKTDQFFCNGWQSWSESRLQNVNSEIKPLRKIARKAMGLYGDEWISGIPRGKGALHSWTYTYLKNAENETFFLGSLNEKTGFTLFLLDEYSGRLTIRRDLDHLDLTHSFPVFDLFISKKKESEAFADYFKKMEITPPSAQKALGWTSWYRHFTKIDESIILKNLDSMAELLAEKSAAKIFQIDDGWQTQIGDWLSIKPDFPNGMGQIARKIREKGFKPGLWLAPFVVSIHSEIYKKHPDWLLQDAKNRPIKVGWNPLWGGWYFALDFFKAPVREYLTGVFHIIFEKWGFEIVKLDFLFAACLQPPTGITRGQAMHGAMEWLRKQAGDRQILACGVPLGSCFGLVDYCRIGGDIHTSWEHPLLAFFRHRERVSTIASLRTTLGRWQLNERAFQNDPDVFILRKDGQKLTPAQQRTLLIINVLCGNLLFTSDDPNEWTAESLAVFEEVMEYHSAKILSIIELSTDVFQIDFLKNDQKFNAICNLTDQKFETPKFILAKMTSLISKTEN